MWIWRRNGALSCAWTSQVSLFAFGLRLDLNE